MDVTSPTPPCVPMLFHIRLRYREIPRGCGPDIDINLGRQTRRVLPLFLHLLPLLLLACLLSGNLERACAAQRRAASALPFSVLLLLWLDGWRDGWMELDG